MGSTQNVKKARLTLSLNQLKTLRRFLKRACDCAEGNCPTERYGKLSVAWYEIKPLMKKAQDAIHRLKGTT